MKRHLRAPVHLSASALALGVLLAGCTPSPESPTSSEAAAELAKALSSGDLADVRFSGRAAAPPQQWWDQAVEAMAGSTLRVKVAEVRETAGGDEATATLAYDWDLAGTGAPWTYETSARLTRAEEQWSVERDPLLVAPGMHRGEVLRLGAEPAPRGDILGADDVALVTERPVQRLGIDKTQVPAGQQAASARRLAELVGVDARGFVDRVRAAGEKAFVEAIVLREHEIEERVRDGYPSIRGAVALRDEIPLAPSREFARPILGSVGPVTAEIVKESDGAYRAGDQAGLSGLQQRYDERLRGTPGFVVEAVDAETGADRKLFDVAPHDGEPLRTTLDERLQLTAEELLSGVRPASALVAVRPSDGAVLAAASGPGSNGYSTATVGTYAPGSTFKVVSSLALLRAGLTPTTTVPCPATTVVDGKSFKNYDDYPADRLGDIDLRTAVANSCNTAFVSQRDKVTEADLADAAASLGLGVDHDLGFPAYLGELPDSATATGHAAALIGQGKVLASPLAMAAVVASVAKGDTVLPRLLVDQAAGPAQPGTPLTEREATQLAGLMHAVVTEGSASFLADLPGAPVLAKTGTAEFGDHDPPQTHAWMVGAQGDLAVAVFVDLGESGSGTAGPILEEFLRRSR